MISRIREILKFWKIDRQLALRYRQQRNDVAAAYAAHLKSVRVLAGRRRPLIVDAKQTDRLIKALEEMRR